MPPATSPRIETFGVFDGTTGAPVTGAAAGCAFLSYKDDLGNDLTPVPTFTEVAPGLYKFTPTLPSSASRGVMYLIDTGAGRSPRYYWKYLRPEEYDEDKVKTLYQEMTGRWQIHATGPDANRLVMYDADGTTVLFKFDLFDVNGVPTFNSPFQRAPV